ncbi:trace amine-associated receptor 9-like [Amphiura filiformis]|uniref:trace amine-associated receptor 9-like n=1 Tax=Amphiura filiformis TaxID=82378 RepID=UPI003B21E6D4
MENVTGNSSSVNGTEHVESVFEEQWKIGVKTVILAITTFLILFGNSFCLVVLRKTNMNEVSRQFMYSLSISDLMVGIIITLPATISSPFGYWPLSNTMCFINALIGGAIAFITSWALVALSVERYITICYPLRYPAIVTLTRTRIALVSIWFGALAYETLVAYIYNFKVFYDTYACWFISTSSGNWILYISLSIYLIFPLCIILILYGRMFSIARKHLNRIQAEENQVNRSEGRNTKRESKAATTFVIITFAYGICAVSGILFSLYENITENDAPNYTSFVVFLAIYGNSWVNVVVYYWRTRSFRQTAGEIVSKISGFEGVPQSGTTSSSS